MIELRATTFQSEQVPELIFAGAVAVKPPATSAEPTLLMTTAQTS
jgi:hypothetical protein